MFAFGGQPFDFFGREIDVARGFAWQQLDSATKVCIEPAPLRAGEIGDTPQDGQPAIDGGGFEFVADAVGFDGFSDFDYAGKRLAGDGGFNGGDFADEIVVAFEQGGLRR